MSNPPAAASSTSSVEHPRRKPPTIPRLEDTTSSQIHRALELGCLATAFFAPPWAIVLGTVNAGMYVSEGHGWKGAVEFALTFATAPKVFLRTAGYLAKTISGAARAAGGVERAAGGEVIRLAEEGGHLTRGEAASTRAGSGRASGSENVIPFRRKDGPAPPPETTAKPEPSPALKPDHRGDGDLGKYVRLLKDPKALSLQTAKTLLPQTPLEYATAASKPILRAKLTEVAYRVWEPSHEEAYRLYRTEHPYEAYSAKSDQYLSNDHRPDGANLVLTPTDADKLMRSAGEFMDSNEDKSKEALEAIEVLEKEAERVAEREIQALDGRTSAGTGATNASSSAPLSRVDANRGADIRADVTHQSTSDTRVPRRADGEAGMEQLRRLEQSADLAAKKAIEALDLGAGAGSAGTKRVTPPVPSTAPAPDDELMALKRYKERMSRTTKLYAEKLRLSH